MNEFPLIPIYCPGGVAALRLKMRTENHIKGSLCNDYVCSHFCTLCVLCQMKREKDSLTKLEVSKQINTVHQHSAWPLPCDMMGIAELNVCVLFCLLEIH